MATKEIKLGENLEIEKRRIYIKVGKTEVIIAITEKGLKIEADSLKLMSIRPFANNNIELNFD